MSVSKRYVTTVDLAQSGQSITVSGVSATSTQITATTFLTGPRGPIDTSYTDAQLAALFRDSDFTVTVGTGGDYSTVNAAITALSSLKPKYKKSGFTATIQLLTGFTMAEQVLVKSVDLSWITITSVDAEVPVDPTAITTELVDLDNITPIIGGTDNATLPIIGALFAYPDQGDGYAASPKDGVAVTDNSQVLFKPGAGVKRPRNGLKVLYGSSATCYMPGLTQGGAGSGAGTVTGVDFSYATARAVHVGFGSQANLARSILHHSKGDYGIYVIWGSHGDFYQSKVHDSLGNAITCRDGSFANMRETDVARSRRGYHALHNGRINARSNTTSPWVGDAAQDCVQYGVLASYNSHIDASDLNVSGSGIGVNLSNASSVSFINGVADNCTTFGVGAFSGSTVDATGASADNCGEGFKAQYGSTISATTSSATNCAVGYHATDDSTISANNSNADNCGIGFESWAASTINADTSTANSCTDIGYYATETSRIQARNSSANNATNHGFHAERSSTINARGSSATGCPIAFYAFENSDINAQSTTITGAGTGYHVDRDGRINAGARTGSATTLSNIPLNYRSGKGFISDSAAAMLGMTLNETTGRATFAAGADGISKSDVGLGNVPNTDATSRANHTGTQTASTISDFDAAAKLAVVDNSITSGVIDKAPSEDAVYRASKATVVATSTADMDNYVNNGHYVFTSGATLSNAPSGNTNGYLIVISDNPTSTSGQSNNVKQVWFRMGTNGTNDMNTHVRSRNGASWSSWTQYVDTNTTQTLVNKRVSPRANTTASSSILTPTGDSSDVFAITALATNASIAAPSGTPLNGQRLTLRIKDDGTARTLTWNAIYRAIGVTLPATTVATKTLYLDMLYNTADTKWDVILVAPEA